MTPEDVYQFWFGDALRDPSDAGQRIPFWFRSTRDTDALITAHFNVAATRAANNRLTNLFLGVVMGYSIQAYRTKHFGHHREIGKPEDPERHYFDALDWRFFVRTLSGVRTFNEIRDRLGILLRQE